VRRGDHRVARGHDARCDDLPVTTIILWRTRVRPGSFVRGIL